MSFPTASTATRVAVASLVILLAACSKQEAQPESFPAGNGGGDVLTVEECERLPDPPAADESAASRSAAVSQGAALRAACKENSATQAPGGKADLARIRELKEKEDAQRSSATLSQKQYNDEAKDAASKPRIEIKY